MMGGSCGLLDGGIFYYLPKIQYENRQIFKIVKNTPVQLKIVQRRAGNKNLVVHRVKWRFGGCSVPAAAAVTVLAQVLALRGKGESVVVSPGLLVLRLLPSGSVREVCKHAQKAHRVSTRRTNQRATAQTLQSGTRSQKDTYRALTRCVCHVITLWVTVSGPSSSCLLRVPSSTLTSWQPVSLAANWLSGHLWRRNLPGVVT